MSFPTTSVLDNFNRANEDPLANGTWTAPLWTGFANLKIAGNEVQFTDPFATAYWSASTFGADCECYFTIVTPSTGGRNQVAFARLQNPGTASLSGYEVKADSNTTVLVIRNDNKVETTLGSTISQSFSAGDGLGIEVIGTTITAYRRAAGVWSSLGSRTDATYGSAGNIGLASGSGDLDDFGGGTISAAVVVSGKLYTLTHRPRPFGPGIAR